MSAQSSLMPGSQAPPGGHPLVGHLSMFRRDPLGFLTHCARNYGDMVPLRLGPFRVHLLSHPDLIEEVLVTKSRHFIKSRGLRANRLLLGNGLLTSEHDFWRRQRRLAQPAFHRQRIALYGEQMVDLAQQLAASWHDGDTRDVQQEMLSLTMAIVTRTLFSADVGGRVADVHAALSLALQNFNSRIGTLFLLPEWLPTPGNLRLRRAVRLLDTIIFRIIRERRQLGEDHADLLSMLLEAQDEEEGGGMTDRQLRDELMTLFLAGHETTANLLCWTWMLLALHPEVEERLQTELSAVLAGRPPAVADLPSLPYTSMVLQEALRLYPPAWILGRQAREACTIGGRTLPARSIVLMSQWVVQRDPRFFAEPEGFNPERWRDSQATHAPQYAYFPFGGGPRLCIGRSFALTEAALILATLAQHFRLKLATTHAVRPETSITLRPAGGMSMQLLKR